MDNANIPVFGQVEKEVWLDDYKSLLQSIAKVKDIELYLELLEKASKVCSSAYDDGVSKTMAIYSSVYPQTNPHQSVEGC